MNAMNVAIGLVLVIAATIQVEVDAQQRAAPPATASAEVMQCAQAQMVVDQLLAAATARLETARQTNTAAELRAAVDSLQGTVRDARAQLAPCATMEPSGAAMGHSKMPMGTAPPTTPSPSATAPAAAPMDHAKMPMGTTPAAKPASGRKPPAAAPMDHSKMPMGSALAAKPAPGGKPPAAAPMDHSKMPMGAAPAAKPAPGAKPPAAAPMDHSKMSMDTAPAAKPAAGAKPSAAAPMDHANMPMGGSANDKSQPTDPVCGLKVDPATAPTTTVGGQTHYFCSEQHRELFQKNPTKYLPKGR